MAQLRRTALFLSSAILFVFVLGASHSSAHPSAAPLNEGTIPPEFNPGAGWGIITQDTTWGGEMQGGEIHLRGDVLVVEDITLTIKPGTTITFDPVPDPDKEISHEDMKAYYGEGSYSYLIPGKYQFFVHGNLNASGTPLRPITFRNVEEPYYPINLYTEVMGNALLQYVETGGIEDDNYPNPTFKAYGDSTIFSSTFHGPGVFTGRTTFCSNTVDGGFSGSGLIWNNTINGSSVLETLHSYPSHIAGNTFNVNAGGYGLIIQLKDCFHWDGLSTDDPDQCRIMVEDNTFNGGLEGIRISGQGAPPTGEYDTHNYGPPQVFIRNNRFEGQTYGISLYGADDDSGRSLMEQIYLGDFYPGKDGLDEGGNSFINVGTSIFMQSVLWSWRHYPFDLKAENNYWGYDTRAEIEAHIYDEDQVCGGSCDYVGDVDVIPFLKAEKRMEPPSEPCTAHGSPILLRTGDYTYQTSDLSLASIGADIEMRRTYHAQDGFDGPFGPGWSTAYFIQAITTKNGGQTQVLVRMDDGTRMTFNQQPDGSFSPAQAWDAVLTQNGGLYQLATLNGNTYSFNANGWLASKTDRAGNVHSVTYTPEGRVSQVLDASGRGISFSYTAGGKVNQMQDHTSRAWTYSYNGDGFLSQATDPAGQSLTYTYDASGNLTRVLGEDGQILHQVAYNPVDQATGFAESGWPVQVSYNPAANQATETDSYGNQTQYSYNNQGQRTSVTDPLGRITQLTWDAAANNTGITTPGGAQFTTAFDANGYPRTHTDALNQTWETVYRADGQIASITDRLGGTTTFGYDAQGNQTSMTDRLSHTTQYVYDSDGQLTQIISPEGRTYTYELDPQSGTAISTRDGLNREVTYAVDTLGRPVVYTDTVGNRYLFEYDALGQMTEITDPLNQTTSYGHDAYGNVYTVTNPAGHTFTYESDAHGQLYTEVDPLGNTWFWDYDLQGNLSTEIDPVGRIQSYTYDAVGQLISVTTPLGSAFQFDYDLDGSLIRWKDPDGNLTTYEYDALHRLKVFTDTLGYRTTYGYDPEGNPTQMVDARSNTTQYSYDAEGRLTGITNPAGGTLSYTYDPDGLRETRQDLDGSTFTFTYDMAGQLTQAAHSSGANLTLGYHTPGLINQYVDDSGTVSIGYDALDRPTQVTDVFNNTVTVAYGTNGEAQTVNLPGGLIVTYTYDDAERLQTAQFSGQTIDFGLNPVGEVVTQTWSGGPSILTAYNALGLPTSRTVKRLNGTTLTEHTATYDSMGRRLMFDSSIGQVSYSYDTNSQLTQAIHPTLGTINYTYDGVGNRISAGGVTATYDNLNRLTSSTNGLSYTYDSNNRRATRTGGTPHTYTYDHRHMLTEVDFGDGTQTQYTYDGRGKLAQTTHRDGSVSRYVYFGDRLVAVTDGTNTVQIQFIYGVHADVPVALVTGGQVYMLIMDAVGTVHGLVDQSGNLVASYTYGPWGEVLSETGSVDQPLRFTGRIYDGDAQLALHGLRWYDPETGTFLTPDPLAYELDGLLTVNHYWYADGDPVNGVDIEGLQYAPNSLFYPRAYKKVTPNQARESGKKLWGVLKATPIVGTAPSVIDAVWYYGKGIYKSDPNSIKKAGREITGLVASQLVPSCKAGASLFKHALTLVVQSIASQAGYNTPEIIEEITKRRSGPVTVGGPSVLNRGMNK